MPLAQEMSSSIAETLHSALQQQKDEAAHALKVEPFWFDSPYFRPSFPWSSDDFYGK